jgi:hypothetical protein
VIGVGAHERPDAHLDALVFRKTRHGATSVAPKLCLELGDRTGVLRPVEEGRLLGDHSTPDRFVIGRPGIGCDVLEEASLRLTPFSLCSLVLTLT